MSTYRENLIDRIANLYGLENVYTIMVCELCQIWPETPEWNKTLEDIVADHETNPIFSEDWKILAFLFCGMIDFYKIF